MLSEAQTEKLRKVLDSYAPEATELILADLEAMGLGEIRGDIELEYGQIKMLAEQLKPYESHFSLRTKLQLSHPSDGQGGLIISTVSGIDTQLY